jgi:hypothetical protein
MNGTFSVTFLGFMLWAVGLAAIIPQDQSFDVKLYGSDYILTKKVDSS